MRLSKKSFIAWIEAQPLDRQFTYTDTNYCLIASWLKETGAMTNPLVRPGIVSDDVFGNPNIGASKFPHWLDEIDDAMIDIVDGRRDYGAKPDSRVTVVQLRNHLADRWDTLMQP